MPIDGDETDTLAHVPNALLAPAPGRPGHFVLGYDGNGHCPMLRDDACSIYSHRPRACRAYDCRVFAATGVIPDAPAVEARVAVWRFAHPTPRDQQTHDAVIAAAQALDQYDRALATIATRPRNATHRAVLAVEISDIFVGRAPPPGEAEVAVAINRRRPPPVGGRRRGRGS